MLVESFEFLHQRLDLFVDARQWHVNGGRFAGDGTKEEPGIVDVGKLSHSPDVTDSDQRSDRYLSMLTSGFDHGEYVFIDGQVLARMVSATGNDAWARSAEVDPFRLGGDEKRGAGIDGQGCRSYRQN